MTKEEAKAGTEHLSERELIAALEAFKTRFEDKLTQVEAQIGEKLSATAPDSSGKNSEEAVKALQERTKKGFLKVKDEFTKIK